MNFNFYSGVQTDTSMIDWNEIIYIIIGAAIGLISSITIIIIERFLNEKGKLNIFYRRMTQRGFERHGWGFENGGAGNLFFTVPIFWEIQNTSNTTRVVRDVSLLLVSGNICIGKMTQMEGIEVTTKSGTKVTSVENYNFGAEKGSYSFVIPPRTIQRQECEYMYIIHSQEKDNKKFDTVVVRYYGENNKAHYFKMMKVDNCWTPQNNSSDKEWLLLNEKIKTRIDYGN